MTDLRLNRMQWVCAVSFALLLCAAATHGAHAQTASSCDGVSRTITAHQRAAWTPAIRRYWGKVSEGRVKKVKIFASLRYAGWTVLGIEVFVGDGGYDFYSGDPARTKPVTSFDGAATVYEGPEVEAEILKGAPGIPKKLAECFAYHVTLEGR